MSIAVQLSVIVSYFHQQLLLIPIFLSKLRNPPSKRKLKTNFPKVLKHSIGAATVPTTRIKGIPTT